MLKETHSNNSSLIKTYKEWFQHYESDDFDVKEKNRLRKPKKFEDEKLQALLDADSPQTEEQLATSPHVTEKDSERRNEEKSYQIVPKKDISSPYHYC